MRFFFRVQVFTEKGKEEFLPEELYRLSPSGVEILEKKDYTILSFFPEDPETFIKYASVSLEYKKIEIKKERLKNFIKITRDSFTPIKIGSLYILPPWEKKKKNSIVILPGLAFGTGRHESTKIMIKLMERIDMEGKRVIDLGCGTGILSIFASKLKAKKVFAIDHDFDAVLSAKKNFLLNRIENTALACIDLQFLKGEFDIILANLDFETFERNKEVIKNLLKKDGLLVISGILKDERKRVISLFHPLKSLTTLSVGDFSGTIFKKPC